MSELRKASEIEPKTDKTEEQLSKERVSKTVKARRARQEALRRSGALAPSSTGTDTLEQRLRRIEGDIADSFRVRQVVRKTRKGR